jgi:endonuclease-3
MKRRTKKLQDKVDNILRVLDNTYPTMDKCYLNYNTDWQLLIATILSAQCTDDRVNLVTKDLFRQYKTLEDFASANQADMEQAIHSAGFYRNKAKNIIAACGELLTRHGGVMPSSVEELTALSGVGRKTANVVRTHIFHIPSIVVDTHVKRISTLTGITDEEDPVKIEFDLMRLFPEEHWGRYNTQVIAHGRSVCKARRPACEVCTLKEFCDHYCKK